jgi:hypothetical protein
LLAADIVIKYAGFFHLNPSSVILTKAAAGYQIGTGLEGYQEKSEAKHTDQKTINFYRFAVSFGPEIRDTGLQIKPWQIDTKSDELFPELFQKSRLKAN